MLNASGFSKLLFVGGFSLAPVWRQDFGEVDGN
jgi:hypothetical protein